MPDAWQVWTEHTWPTHPSFWGVTSKDRLRAPGREPAREDDGASTWGWWSKVQMRPGRAGELVCRIGKSFWLTQNGWRFHLIGSWEEYGVEPILVFGHALYDFWIGVCLPASCVRYVSLPSGRWETLRENPEPNHTAASRGDEQAEVWLQSSAYISTMGFIQRPEMLIIPRQLQMPAGSFFIIQFPFCLIFSFLVRQRPELRALS